MGTLEKIERPLPSSPVMTPMDMLEKAVSQGAGIEVLEKLMNLQERWEATNARREFDDAVSCAKAEMPPIVKNRKGHNDKAYADFAAIAKVVDPVLSKYGLSYRFRTTQTDRINVTCILSHKSGHCEENTLAGPADTSGNKNAIQSIGSTLSYLQRYSLIQSVGLSVADDDDGKAGGRGECITDEQAMALRDLIESTGAPKDKFLRWAKIERLEDLQLPFYESAVAAIKAAGKKAQS